MGRKTKERSGKVSFALKLVDINEDVCEQFRNQFKEYENIEVYNGYFEDVEKYDCMVSPANSFGMMDGGIDAAITDFFGKELQQRVQNHIISHFFGEQPVGTSFIVRTGHKEHPYLAHTPTMRIPQNIQGTLNVYYAMKAMLSAVKLFNEESKDKIGVVLCPGFGTLYGQMDPSEAVGQMVLAYEHFLNPPMKIDLPYIKQRLIEIQSVLK